MPTAENHNLHKGQSSVTPIPDPTLLTTAAVGIAFSSLKELMFTRLDAMDKAQELYKETVGNELKNCHKELLALETLLTTLSNTRWESLQEKLTTLVGIRIEAKQNEMALINEKFVGVDKRFEERDKRISLQEANFKVIMDEALSSSEKASLKQTETFSATISKTETATSKQIDQQGETIKTSTNGLNDKIEDVRTRLARIEASREGSHDERNNRQQSGMFAFAGLGLFITIISVGFAIYEGNRSSPPTNPQIIYVPATASTTAPVSKVP
jgi:hypothetical protein